MSEGIPPSTGEFRSPASETLEHARLQSTRTKWYVASVIAAIVWAIATVVVFRQTGVYYPFFSGIALLLVVAGGFGPSIAASFGSVLLSHVIPPAGVMMPPTEAEQIRLLANLLLLFGVSVIAGLFRRSRLQMYMRESRLENAVESTREILHELSDAIVLTDSDLRVTYLNPQAEEMFKYPGDSAFGLSVRDVITPESMAKLPLQLDALATGRTIRTERTAFRADGSRFEIDIAARFLADGRMLASVRDVTERKNALERQRVERDLLNGIMATSVAGIMVVNLRQEIVFANQRGELLFDLQKSNLDQSQYDHPVWRQASLDHTEWTRAHRPFDRVVATNAPVYDVRLAIVWPDGRRVALSVNGAPLRSVDGELQSVVFAVNDITEALDAERKSRERDRQLEEITQAIPGLVFQYELGEDRTGRFVYVSGYAAVLQNRSGVDLLNDPSTGWSIVHPDDVQAVRESVMESHRTLQPWIHEFRVREDRVPGSWRWVSGRADPRERAETGNVVWNGILLDITDRRRLEDQLHQAQRIESIGRLAGGIAHDFNNLLTVILGRAELLNLDLADDGPHREDIEQIKLAAESGSALTRQLLGFARRQIVSPVIVNINTLAGRLPPLVGRLLGAGVTLSLELMDDAPRVRADPMQIDQVLMNLAVNARDAMPFGGTLRIHTRRVVAGGAANGAPGSVPSGEYAEIAVVDSGVGMTDDVRSRAFEPFFTTKGVGKGTGLGLATSYGIVSQTNGYMSIESVVGRGTTVRILLPITTEVASTTPTSSSVIENSRHDTVLVVDDDESVLRVTAAVLRRQGYRVLESSSAAQALKQSRAEPGSIQLLLTDVVMPDMSGPELAGILRQERPDLRVLYISGYADGALSQHGVLAAGVLMLQKPYDIGELANRVREVLAPAV